MWLGDATTTTPAAPAVDPNSWQGVVQSLVPLISQGLQVFDQQKLLDYNLSLIQKGQQPLTDQQVQMLTAGLSPTLNVGLAAPQQQLLTYALYGGGALLSIYLIARFMQEGRRRR